MIHVKHPTKEERESIRKAALEKFKESQEKNKKDKLEKKRKEMRNFFASNAPPYPRIFPSSWEIEQCARELARWRYAYANAMLVELEKANGS